MYHLTEAYLMAGLICVSCLCLGLLVGLRQNSQDARSVIRHAVIGSLFFTVTLSLASAFTAVPLSYVFLLIILASLMVASFFTAFLRVSSRPAGTAGETLFFRAGLMLGTLVIAGLVYVLPGQFTFWSPSSTPFETTTAAPHTTDTRRHHGH